MILLKNRRYSKQDFRQPISNSQTFPRKYQAYHSPDHNSSKFNIEMSQYARDNQLSFTAPYNKRAKSKFNTHNYEDGERSVLPKIHSRPHMNHMGRDDDRFDSYHHHRYNSAGDEYDSDYLGPRKPFMREDRSTSPPDHDPLFRRAHQRSIGIQEVDSRELLVERPKKRSTSKKKVTPRKIKFTKNFMKKYPTLFKDINTKRSKGGKKGRMLTVIYKPWIPSSSKFATFDEIAHRYKIYGMKAKAK